MERNLFRSTVFLSAVAVLMFVFGAYGGGCRYDCMPQAFSLQRGGRIRESGRQNDRQR